MAAKLEVNFPIIRYGLEFEYPKYKYTQLSEIVSKQVQGIYTKYQKHLVFPLVQAEYIDHRIGPEKLGVCRAISVAWCARVLKGLSSFNCTKHGIKPLSIEHGLSWQKRFSRFFKKFCLEQIKFSLKQNLELKHLLKIEEQIIYSTDAASSQKSLANLTKLIDPRQSQQTFLLRLKSADPENEGHMISASVINLLDKQMITIMDPNAGEFVFTSDDLKPLGTFFADLIAAYTHSIQLDSIIAIEVTKSSDFEIAG